MRGDRFEQREPLGVAGLGASGCAAADWRGAGVEDGCAEGGHVCEDAGGDFGGVIGIEDCFAGFVGRGGLLVVGLDECDDAGSRRGLEPAQRGGDAEALGGPAHIEDDNIHKFGRGEVEGVAALEGGDARVGAELPGERAVAGIDCEDPGCAGLQQAVGEAADVGAEISAREPCGVEAEGGERVLQLEPAAGCEGVGWIGGVRGRGGHAWAEGMPMTATPS